MAIFNELVGGKPTFPLAQTFLVSELQGIFITSIDVFFSSKHSKLPVTLQIRPTADGGAPHISKIMPGTSVSLPPSAINTSNDGSVATRFRFEEPVYLKGGRTYAFTLKTAAKNTYKVWCATQGDFEFGTTTKRVTRDPIPGALYKNQTGLSYQPDVASDLKYILYRAKFDQPSVGGPAPGSTSGMAVFINADPQPKRLQTNPLRGTAGTSSVEVLMPHHGFIKDDFITLSNWDSATVYNGVKGSSINGKRAITHADWRSFRVNLDSNVTDTIRFGGSNRRATRQDTFTSVQLQTDDYMPLGTTIRYSGMMATHGSHADSDLLDAAYTRTHVDRFKKNVDINLTVPHVLATRDNEFHKLADSESFLLKAILQRNTSNDRVAPFINLENAQLLTTMNVIDYQDSASWSGRNVPVRFVPETHPRNGSSAAKHITKPVQLALGATGLKILIAANRPPGTDFDLYYKTSITGGDSDLNKINWIYADPAFTPREDENPDIFREYQYTIGDNGSGFAKALPEFDRYQLKIVFNSKNPAIVPRVTDMRTIALGNDD